MNHHRFTIKELKEMSDAQFMAIILNERRNSCTNPNAPLFQRIKSTVNRLEQGTLTGYTPKRI